MITKLSLLHYLSEKTYKKICRKLDLDDGDSKIQYNDTSYSEKLICRIHPFNIQYRKFGHVWFLSVDIDFQMYRNENENFEQELFSEYAKIFGKDVMSDFPSYEKIYCGYIEYSDVVAVSNADNIIYNMKILGCPPEQLDENRWAEYKKPHGTIEFCVSKVDDTHIKILARCHGTALQKRIKDKSLHHMGAGVSAAKMVSEETENEIMRWLYAKHNIAARTPIIITKRANKHTLSTFCKVISHHQPVSLL